MLSDVPMARLYLRGRVALPAHIPSVAALRASRGVIGVAMLRWSVRVGADRSTVAMAGDELADRARFDLSVAHCELSIFGFLNINFYF